MVGRLLPGASSDEITRLETLDGVRMTEEGRAYWSRVGGVTDGEPWGHSYFFGHIYLPQSVEQAVEHYAFLADMRENERQNPVFDADQEWPKGMVRFAGEDGNGLYLNFIPGSPTLGAVYEQSTNSSPFLRVAGSMQEFFTILVAALDAGALRLIDTPGEYEAVGELITDYERYEAIRRSINPSLPVWDHHWRPDWI